MVTCKGARLLEFSVGFSVRQFACVCVVGIRHFAVSFKSTQWKERIASLAFLLFLVWGLRLERLSVIFGCLRQVLQTLRWQKWSLTTPPPSEASCQTRWLLAATACLSRPHPNRRKAAPPVENDAITATRETVESQRGNARIYYRWKYSNT